MRKSGISNFFILYYLFVIFALTCLFKKKNSGTTTTVDVSVVTVKSCKIQI